MDPNDIHFSANLRVLARQATLQLRSPMNTDPDPVDLPILDEIAALTERAKAEFERLIREHRGYGVGDIVQIDYESGRRSHAPRYRVVGFDADPHFDVVVLLARIKKDGGTSSKVERHSPTATPFIRISGPAKETS